MRLLVAALAALLLLAAAAQARPGELDRGFSGNGLVVGDRTGEAEVVRAAGGRIATLWGPWYDRRLVAYDGSGTRDRGFTGATLVQAAAPARRGLVTAAFGADDVTVIRRLRPDGRPDPAFTVADLRDDTHAIWWPTRVVVDARDRILLIRPEQPGATVHAVVHRFTAAGAADPAFPPATLPTEGPIAAVTTRQGGVVVAAMRHRHGVDLYALTATGARDRRFGPAGHRRLDLHDGGMTPTGLVRAGRGRLLLGLAGDRRGHVVRLGRDGRVDRAFDRTNLRGAVTALARDRRGHILAGVDESDDYIPQAVVRRFTRAGRPDRRFGRTRIDVRRRNWDGTVVTSLATDRRGRVLAAGAAYDGFVAGREDFGRRHPLLARLRR